MDFDGETVETVYTCKGFSDSKVKADLWVEFGREICHAPPPHTNADTESIL